VTQPKTTMGVKICIKNALVLAMQPSISASSYLGFRHLHSSPPLVHVDLCMLGAQKTPRPQHLAKVHLHRPLLLRCQTARNLSKIEVRRLDKSLDALYDVIGRLALEGLCLKGLYDGDEDLAGLVDGGGVLSAHVRTETDGVEQGTYCSIKEARNAYACGAASSSLATGSVSIHAVATSCQFCTLLAL
jgi:hypothetical protein